jgi:hypothetical protein
LAAVIPLIALFDVRKRIRPSFRDGFGDRNGHHARTTQRASRWL